MVGAVSRSVTVILILFIAGGFTEELSLTLLEDATDKVEFRVQ